MSEASTPNPPQAQPKVRGGFEIDEDEEDGYNDAEQDDSDVYDPAISLQFDDVPAEDTGAVQIDRASDSPEQENGITTAAVQSVDVPADIPSTLPNPSELRTGSVTPAQAPLTYQNSSTTDLQSSVGSAAPKTRLAHDVIGILEDRIKDDPRGDIAAWLELIEELKNRNKDSEVRSTYDRFFEIFPTAAEQWRARAKWEESNENRMELEKVFNASLLKVPDVELWSIYINYIRRRNNMQTGDVAKSYKIVNSAFSFCLDQIGMDKDAGNLWQDYIDFLKNGPHNINPNGTWEDKAKIDTIREAYQKALSVPTSALLTLWREYDSFETGMNKITGRKFLQERSPAYMTARTAYTQLQNLTKDLQRISLPRLPPAIGYEGDTDYAQQVALWKQWIKWEKDDNLVLKDDDVEQYRKRVLFTYKQALMALQFWPEMWFDAATFCFNNNLHEEGMKFLREGFQANLESPLLAFKLADSLEIETSKNDSGDPGAKERMKKVRQPYDQVLDALYAVEKKTDARLQHDVRNAESEASTTNGDVNGGEDDLNASNVALHKAAIDARVQTIRANARAHLDMLNKIISHVWIALMRATRRIQGKGLPNEKGAGFRTIFNEARKRGKLTSEFYVESAQIEWQCYRDPTGTRILERGVKLFPEDNYLPLEYIKHLVTKDDLTNARAVFETTVNRFLTAGTPESIAKAKPLFAYLHDYESKYGELSQIERLESRMREFYPEDPMLKQFAARYSTTFFDPVSVLPIISRLQVLPKSFVQPSIEITNPVNSPLQKVVEPVTTNSPKRPLDDADDFQPRKLIRAESPLKGAAGRKIGQQQRLSSSAVPQFSVPLPLPAQITYLLSILPKTSLYTETRLDSDKIFELIRDIHLPPPGTAVQTRSAQQPQIAPPPGWPASFPLPQQPPAMVQGYLPPGVPQPSYGSAPFRYP